MDHVANFLTHLSTKDVSKNTVAAYRASLQRFVTFNASKGGPDGGLPPIDSLAQATTENIIYFKNQAPHRGIAPRTLHLTLVHLKVFYDYLIANGVTDFNPVANVRNVTIAKVAPKWLTRPEMFQLKRALEREASLREYAIVYMLRHTGLRVEELTDVELDEVTIKERSGDVYVKGGRDGRDRVVPLNSEIRAILRAYLVQRPDNGPYLFNTQRSAKCSTRAIQTIIEKYRDRTGIENLTCHALRHTFAHEMIVEGEQLHIVADLLGHYHEDGTPNIEMTVRYTLPGEEDRRRAVERTALNPEDLKDPVPVQRTRPVRRNGQGVKV